MRILLLPLTHRFGIYTLSLVATGLLAALVWYTPHQFPYVFVPLLGFAGLSVLGTRDLLQTKARDPTQLSDLGASTLSARGDTA
jgi:hypothetical protein